jgi:membrane protein DedA with SNARE-associated domain
LDRWSFADRQYQQHRGRVESYFELWGSATVLIGRFVAVGRAFVPFAAGRLMQRCEESIIRHNAGAIANQACGIDQA